MKILCYGIDNTTEPVSDSKTLDNGIDSVNVTYLKYKEVNSFDHKFKVRKYKEDAQDGYRSLCEIQEVDFESLPTDSVFNYEGNPFQCELITNIKYEDEFVECFGGERYNNNLPFKGDILLLRGVVVGVFGTMNCEDYYPYSRTYLNITLIFSILKHKKDTEGIE